MNIRLDETEFRKLVKGEIVEIEGARIILADIGFARMYNAINSAWDEANDRDEARLR